MFIIQIWKFYLNESFSFGFSLSISILMKHWNQNQTGLTNFVSSNHMEKSLCYDCGNRFDLFEVRIRSQ